MPNHILITGAKGQLGCELNELSKYNEFKHHHYYFADRNTLDIGNKLEIEAFCLQHKITVIINCAAYTAVDKAEEDEVAADHINHLAVKYLSQVAKKENIRLIHISTDYVFDGTNCKPYVETDKVNPQGIYGKTKLDGEHALCDINPKDAMIIRTSWVYSSFGNNFVKTMLHLGEERDTLGVIFDQVGTPTYARDLAKTILMIMQSDKIIKDNSVQIYHYSNEGVSSWYDFSKAIFEQSGICCQVNPIRTEQYPTPAKRPYYSVMNKEKIKDTYGIAIPYWKDSLISCISLLYKD